MQLGSRSFGKIWKIKNEIFKLEIDLFSVYEFCHKLTSVSAKRYDYISEDERNRCEYMKKKKLEEAKVKRVGVSGGPTKHDGNRGLPTAAHWPILSVGKKNIVSSKLSMIMFNNTTIKYVFSLKSC